MVQVLLSTLRVFLSENASESDSQQHRSFKSIICHVCGANCVDVLILILFLSSTILGISWDVWHDFYSWNEHSPRKFGVSLLRGSFLGLRASLVHVGRVGRHDTRDSMSGNWGMTDPLLI